MSVVEAPARRKRGAARATRPRPSGIAALNSAIWSVCDVLRRSKCSGAMQYVPELTWILFLRVLDDKEQAQQDEAEAVGATFAPSLRPSYRWRDWAAPGATERKQLEAGALGAFFGFVNGELIPHLKSLALNPNATARQKIIGEALSGVEKTRVRYREKSARCARQGRCGQSACRRRHAYVPAQSGVRGPVAQDGRQEQRRRPVLHAA